MGFTLRQNETEIFAELQVLKLKMMLTTLGASRISNNELAKLENYFQNRDRDYYHKTRIFDLKGLLHYQKGQKKL